MANIVKLKRSSVVGKVPDAGNIEVGEPAVNLVDRILYTKDTGGNVIVIGSGTTSNVIEGSNLYFTNARVVTAISSQTLSNATFSGELVTNSIIKSLNSSGDEGGEFQLAIPAANTSLNGPVAIDVYQNKLRIFETTGTNRGVYIDLSAANSGVGTNLISAGGGGGAVNSVNGQTGTVVLSTANIAENGNSYYTDARVYSNVRNVGYATNANVALKANITDLTTANVTEVTNLYFTNARVYSNVISIGYATNANVALKANITDLTTANVTEVTNLYFTNARVYSNVISIGYATNANVALKANITDLTTSNVSEGNNLYYTAARVYSNVISIGYATNANVALKANITDLTTANVTEVTNLYFTNARSYANTLSAIKTGNGIIYDSANGNITLSTTGVTASTYGGAAVQPVIVVDAFGRITSVSNVTSTVANTNITGNIISSQITSVANSQITGNIISSKLEPTAVTASTYGNATIIPVITVDQQGRITTASNVTSTVANTQISGNIISSQITSVANSQITGNIISSKLEPTAVTASTYGGAAVQPVIVIDQQGRITSASNVTSTVANTNITGNIISSQITSVANSQITGNIISSKLEPTAVTASTYGGAAVQTIITVDQQGRITSASNVTSTVANTNITGNIISSQITSVANSQITGNIISSKLEPTGVTASTYGGAAVQTIITVDQQGRITSASNVTSTVANTNITGNIISSQITSIANSQITGNTISSKLEPTGVTASTYGGAAVQPVIVIDQQGRITSASNVTSTVANTNITGNIISSQITSVANTQISGNIISSQITSVANTQITGNIISSQITSVANTQITGNIISSQITSVANSQITGNTISSKLEPTGVTAGVYGNATIIPVITVDQQGRITNVSNASVTGVSSGTSNAVSNTQIIAGNGTSTNFNLAGYPSTSNTLIFVDGLLQYSPVHYSFSSNTINFVTAPSNGEQIYIVTLAPGTGGGGGASVTISDSVPSASTAGTFWFDSLYLDLYVSYDNTWVMVGGSGAASAGDQLSALLLPGM